MDNKLKLSKKQLAIIAIAILFLIGGGVYYQKNNQSQNNNNPSGKIDITKPVGYNKIKSFDDCIAAGYPLMETYPRSCKLPDGNDFWENIGNAIEKKDQIQVTQPKPNTLITNPTTVIGQARGSWFFEGTFPVVIIDSEGRELGKGNTTAFSDWMTENFVPFEITLEYNLPSTDTGTIILKKDNPSGEPQNDDQLEIPIKFRTAPTKPAN